MSAQSCLCEETSPCTNYPLAICMHCNRRLCVTHLTEHNLMMVADREALTKELEEVTQHINNEYEKTREVYHNILTTINDWRTRQLEKIIHVYENHLQCIETRQEILSNAHQQLTESLDREARQPLKHMQGQAGATQEALDQIRQSIKNTQEGSTQLKWNFPGAPTVKNHDAQVDSQSATSSKQVSSTIDNLTSRRAKLAMSLTTLHDVNLRKFRAFKRLVDMYGNVACIEQSKQEIDEYIRKQNNSLPLPTLISSYLLAWYHNPNANEKTMILNEHLPTLMKYLSSSPNDYTFLLGVHAFFHNERLEGNKRNMMTYLMQFFLDRKCLSRNQILYWYHNKDERAYKGFDGVKQMTTPFIKTLWIQRADAAVQTSPMQSSSGEPQEKT